MSINGITNANFIRVGQVIKLSSDAAPAAPAPATPSAPAAPAAPAAAATTYRVVAGDSLSGIAARFGTTTRNLMSLNGIVDANRIRIGQVLNIVAAAAAPSAPAPVAPAPSTPAPETPAPESPAPSASGTSSYTVVAGNTLSGIAARFGTTTRNLMSLNGITDANRIRIGQLLTIVGTAAAPVAPASSSGPTTSYTVVAGDTLSGIAARFGTTTRNLMALNGISNANFLRIGQVLRLA